MVVLPLVCLIFVTPAWWSEVVNQPYNFCLVVHFMLLLVCGLIDWSSHSNPSLCMATRRGISITCTSGFGGQFLGALISITGFHQVHHHRLWLQSRVGAIVLYVGHARCCAHLDAEGSYVLIIVAKFPARCLKQ